jgi:hypothetical protein
VLIGAGVLVRIDPLGRSATQAPTTSTIPAGETANADYEKQHALLLVMTMPAPGQPGTATTSAIYVIHGDGTGKTLLTNDGGAPSSTPDGKVIFGQPSRRSAALLTAWEHDTRSCTFLCATGHARVQRDWCGPDGVGHLAAPQDDRVEGHGIGRGRHDEVLHPHGSAGATLAADRLTYWRRRFDRTSRPKTSMNSAWLRPTLCRWISVRTELAGETSVLTTDVLPEAPDLGSGKLVHRLSAERNGRAAGSEC